MEKASARAKRRERSRKRARNSQCSSAPAARRSRAFPASATAGSSMLKMSFLPPRLAEHNRQPRMSCGPAGQSWIRCEAREVEASAGSANWSRLYGRAMIAAALFF